MNTPFVCESLLDGAKCGQPATHIYKSAHVTRLICDDCVASLRNVKGALGPAPVVEFALLELVPARQLLLDTNRALKESNDSFRRVTLEDTRMLEERLARSEVRAGVAERAGLLVAYWMWAAIAYGVLATAIGVWGWLHR